MKRTRCKMHSLCDMRCNNTHGAQFIACNSERATWEYATSCGMPHVLQGIATAAILRRRVRGCCMVGCCMLVCWYVAWWDLAWWYVAWWDVLHVGMLGCCMLGCCMVGCWDVAWWDLAWWDLARCASLAAAAGPHGSADRGADACEAFDGAGHRPSCEHSVRHHGHLARGVGPIYPDGLGPVRPSGLAVHERALPFRRAVIGSRSGAVRFRLPWRRRSRRRLPAWTPQDGLTDLGYTLYHRGWLVRYTATTPMFEATMCMEHIPIWKSQPSVSWSQVE
jgi:hypothetical protein